MECNKEEAIRAKEIATTKMGNKDFVGGRKFILKAQRLFPDLENISQILAVCDVHCSAEVKLYGNEMDWYGMLQIDQSANEGIVKKQYRKFALLLHPDKNQFPGAEAAFKLVGEAQRVLLDPQKRSLHDMKRKVSIQPAASYRPPPQVNQNSYFAKPSPPQTNVQSNPNATSRASGLNPGNQAQQTQQRPDISNTRQTFWTVCPFCLVRYQYYKEILNRVLRCQSCMRPFVAREAEDAPVGAQRTHPIPSQKKEVPSQITRNAGQGTSSQKPFSGVGVRGKVAGDNVKAGVSGVADKPIKKDGNKGVKVEKEKKVEVPKSTGKVNGSKTKRGRKQVVESSESCDTGSSNDKKDGKNSAPRNSRSSRPKQNVAYSESLSDEDLESPTKRAKNGHEKSKKQNEASTSEASVPNGDGKSEKVNGKETSSVDDPTSGNASPPDVYEYPDPDFHDFDKGRVGFSVGQVWALYDTLDALPRFYAVIRRVFTPGFKLRITWLEPDPDDDDEIDWVNKDLPVSCGNFQLGESENTEDRLMFSHMISWERGSNKSSYKIHPRKGEIWGLFRNWDIKWKACPDGLRKFDLEFVEVLSEYDEKVGICVAYLGKLKGFACLFCRMVKEGKSSFQIPPNELFRFSHMVPSFKMTGEERKDVPKGSFELDPAALPLQLEEIDVPENLETVKPETVFENGTCSNAPPADEEKPRAVEADKETRLDMEVESSEAVVEEPEAYEIPEPEFYDFDAEKSPEKFQIGQIWALYCDEDGLPKYYAQIKKIEPEPEFKLHVTWLVPSVLPSGMITWCDKKMPICCGWFKLKTSKLKTYTGTKSFSHQLRADLTEKKNVYAIIPRKGEVWALYKNWNDQMMCSELETCEYDIVEILGENNLQMEVLVLERVDGFNSVFKPLVEGGSSVTMEVTRNELLRFSHQIPAYRLTDERDGSLRGYWELDPASLPVLLFCLN